MRSPPVATMGKIRPASRIMAATGSGRFSELRRSAADHRHSPPAEKTVGIEIPARVRQALGLDVRADWAIVSE